jgi:hypothetical protein
MELNCTIVTHISVYYKSGSGHECGVTPLLIADECEHTADGLNDLLSICAQVSHRTSAATAGTQQPQRSMPGTLRRKLFNDKAAHLLVHIHCTSVHESMHENHSQFKPVCYGSTCATQVATEREQLSSS